MIDVVNLQKKVDLDLRPIRAFVADLPKLIGEADSAQFAVALVSDRRMTELNKFFRGKETTTDVLSFPHEPGEFDPRDGFLGDIVISAEQAQKQANQNDLTMQREIKQLILHGVLHLCGYDHETDNGEMNARELELREKLGI